MFPAPGPTLGTVKVVEAKHVKDKQCTLNRSKLKYENEKQFQ
jgi:hypothetical protein